MLSKALLAMASAMPPTLAFQEAGNNLSDDVNNLGIIDEIGTSPCVFKLNSNFYDFTPIKVKYPDPIFPYLEGKAKVEKKDLEAPNYWFVFGWCQHIDESRDQRFCLEDYYAGRIDGPVPKAGAECTPYSGGDPLNDISTTEITGNPKTIKRYESGAVFRDEQLNGVSLKYSNGPACESDPSRQSSLTLNMYCDDNMHWDDYDLSMGVLGDLCEPYIDSVSKVACSRLSVSQLWDYLDQYSMYFGALLLVVGLALVFAGRKLLKPAVCFAGFLTTIMISCFIFYAVYLDQESDLSDFWWFLGGGALAGIFIGLCACWCTRLGAAILAGWGGATVGLMLYSAVIYKAQLSWLFWTTVVFFALLACITAILVLDEVVIAATALLGSYALVRGVACYAGHYYNEFTMAQMAQEGLLDEVDPWYWAYFTGFFVMFGLGLWVQIAVFIKEKKEKARQRHPYLLADQQVYQEQP